MLENGELITNPTRRELQQSKMDLIVTAAKQNLVMMLEGRGNVILLQDLLKAIKHGTREAQLIINQIEKLRKDLNLKPKRELNSENCKDSSKIPNEIWEAIKSMSEMRLKEIFRDYSHDKLSRDHAVNLLRTNVTDKTWSSFPDVEPGQIADGFNKFCIEIFRDCIFEENRRCDGRYMDDLRKIDCKVDLFAPLHGSALYTRGQTQVLCSVTLDSKESALKLDTLSSLDR